jgi:hypothetical protein
MAKKATKKPEKKAAAPQQPKASVQSRLALDRFLIGIWIERDFLALLSSNKEAAAPLRPLALVANLDRLRAAEKLRTQLFGRDRPNELEQFEALLRQAVDCIEGGSSVLPELQHDLLANVDVLPKGDRRIEAMRAVADYAATSQVNVAIQDVGRLAAVTTDREPNARELALKKLKELLADYPYLLPGA